MSFGQTYTEKSILADAKKAENEKDYNQALNLYIRANLLNPKNSTTYYNMAWCQNELEKYEDVLVTAEKGLKISPTSMLYTEYGYALYMQKNYPKAIEKYKKALSLNEAEKGAIKGIADVYFSTKDYTTAEPYYKKCLELNKSIEVANYKLGYIMSEKGDYQKTIEYELAALKINNNYASAYNELGYAYSKLHKDSLALENYIKAYNIDPKDAIYSANIADMYYSINEFKDLDKALEFYKISLAIDNNNVLSNYRAGWILNDNKKYYEAKKYLNKVVEINPKYAEAWIELGWIEFANGNYTTAESNYLKAIQYNTKTELARYYLGQTYIKQYKKNAAQKMVDELKSLNSTYAQKLKDKMDDLKDKN